MWGKQRGIDDRNLDHLSDATDDLSVAYNVGMGTIYYALGIGALLDPVPGDEFIFFAKGSLHFSAAIGKKASNNWFEDQRNLRAASGIRTDLRSGLIEFTC